jgi:polysaccharide export outer membrane protein
MTSNSLKGFLLLIAAVIGFSAGAQENLSGQPGVQPRTSPSSGAGVSAANTVAYTNSMEVLDDKRVLGIGDIVSFRVVEDRKDPTPLAVRDSGEMEVPLIGRVPAAGKTCKQLAYDVKAALEKEYYHSCNVIIGLDLVSTKSRGRVYVMGQVRLQGPQEIPADETYTVSKAILRAGGLSDFANKRRIRLIRKDGNKNVTSYVDLAQVLDKGRADKDPVVIAEDVIIVPEKWINF